MSDQIQSIIPKNANIDISDLDASLVNEMINEFKTIYKDSTIILEDYNQTTFIDPGSNFVSVSCPICERELAIEYWQELMDHANETRFAQLDISLTCCDSKTNLNELNYHFPAGFARFAIRIMNPYNSQILFDNLHRIEQRLNIKLSVITAHY